MKKKQIKATFAIVIVSIALVATFFIVRNQTQELSVVEKVLTFEKYELIPLDVIEKNITTNREKDLKVSVLVDEKPIDLDAYQVQLAEKHKLTTDAIPMVSDFEVQATVGKHVESFRVKVTDTVKPKLEVKFEDVALIDGDEIVAHSLAQVVSEVKATAYDIGFNGVKIPLEVKIVEKPLVTRDDKPQIAFSAKDEAGNETLISVSVIVQDDATSGDDTAKESPISGDDSATISDPGSETVLVNRQRYLPSDYIPPLMDVPTDYAVSGGYEATPNTVNAFIRMVDDMYSETGMWMYVTSSYRDYEFQGELYYNYIDQHGQAEADRMSAKPGTSEHQTGLVMDVVTPGGYMFTFGETEQSAWVNKNAHKYGFIVRYPEGKESITGYMPEAWHLRYLGVDTATSVYNSGLTYDEWYFSN
ncbi:M15 family metallopeptidase [Erysipelothrix sp. HDW6C]|uniref:M15 family metallopeptidase n=1 Tax=Erysipelothrix sp. HDW6C TaxID=2714930 RepID=UPI001409DFB6|nr:M15 family metallopeptidase [Erysipelothrix sp. HDW6C]QIK69488.1 M15 family metallopeptidase [Erysipelothrix sp. HDW6C]